MAAFTLVPVGNNNSQSATFDIPDGNPAHVEFKMQSPVYGTDASLTFDLQAEQSFDGGVTFTPWFGGSGFGGTAGQVFKGVTSDGLVSVSTDWDGVGRTCRMTATVNRRFVWGLTAEVLTV